MKQESRGTRSSPVAMPQTISFIPQFKLVVCSNEFMEIKSMDHGTWSVSAWWILVSIHRKACERRSLSNGMKLDKKYKTVRLLEILFMYDG
jgi:hypothetical protein